MLDEILEYEEYTFDLDDTPYSCEMRLKNYTLKKGLCGVPRAMTIIARHCLFDEVETDTADGETVRYPPIGSSDAFGDRTDHNEEEQIFRIEYARNCLRLWVGDSKGIKPCNEEQKRLECWLPRYLQALTQKEENPLSKDDLNRLLNRLTGRIRGASAASFSKGPEDSGGRRRNSKRPAGTYADPIFENEKSEQNDYHMVTYDRIIARALRLGPLKRYYLAAKRDIEADIKRGGRKDIGGHHVRSSAAGSAEQAEGSAVVFLGGNSAGIRSGRDLLLKLTAAYLLEDRRKDAEEEGSFGIKKHSRKHAYRKISWVDIINWSIRDGKIEKNDLNALTYHGRPVFEKETLNNVSRIRPVRQRKGWKYQSYMEYYGWCILEESELDMVLQEHPEWMIYKDQGSGKPLERTEGIPMTGERSGGTTVEQQATNPVSEAARRE